MSKKKDSLKPWLSRPAVNRSVTLPLTRPLTQRLSNLNEFHPNELDPYLLFDAQSSMLGTLEASTLDLDPSDPSTLEVITATRAGTATYTDASGNIATAPANTVRVDHVNGVPMILVEPSATNLVDYSEDIANNLWGKTGVSVTENAATAPDGTVIASKIQVDSSNSFHFVGKSIPLGAAYYSFSAYLKADTAITASFFLSQSGNNGAVFDLQAGSLISVSGTGNTASIEDVGNGWFRCVVTNNGSSDVADQVRIGVANGAISSFQGNETDSLYIWGAQLETGSVATSYIPTSGGDAAARTRAADDLVISGSAFTDFYNQSEGTFYVEAQSKESYSYQPHYLEAHDASGQNRFAVYTQSVNRLFVTANNSLQAHLSFGSYTPNQLQRVAASYKLNDFVGSSNGSSETGDAGGLVPVNPTALAIGRRYSEGYHIQGHIKRLIYWPTHSDSL